MEAESVNFARFELSEDELQRIYLERFAYREAWKELNKEVPSMPQSAKKYAMAIKYLASHGMLDEYEAIIHCLRESFDSEMGRLKLETSPFGRDDSWIYWDVAKQLYYFLTADRSEVDRRYRIANPLHDEQLREEIIDRHIGWEFHRFGGEEPSSRIPTVQKFLENPEYKSSVYRGQRASWALVELGRTIRTLRR